MNQIATKMMRTMALLAFLSILLASCQRANNDKPPNQERNENAVEADDPVSFGPRCAWLAIRSDKPDAVVRALGLTGVRKCGWKDGVEAAYNADVFVSPCVKGWVFAAGFALVDDIPNVRKLIESLGKEFSDVQYFATHRTVDLHMWARLSNGRLVRFYACDGDRGETLCDLGEVTNDERKLGLIFNNTKFPSEDNVMDLAAAWSIDPTTLDQLKLEKGVGLLGSLDKK